MHVVVGCDRAQLCVLVKQPQMTRSCCSQNVVCCLSQQTMLQMTTHLLVKVTPSGSTEPKDYPTLAQQSLHVDTIVNVMLPACRMQPHSCMQWRSSCAAGCWALRLQQTWRAGTALRCCREPPLWSAAATGTTPSAATPPMMANCCR